MLSPFPEEMNRQVKGRLATYHFAPTKRSQKNLLKEYVSIENILITGKQLLMLYWKAQIELKIY